MERFDLFRKKDNEIIQSEKLSIIFDNWKNDEEHWLFISPHDDDLVIGSGILLQKAIAEKIKISILITTDGSMGYCSLKDRDNIVKIRHLETLNSFNKLGIKNVEWLNFPDGTLNLFIGRRKSFNDDPCIIEECTGLQNAYTHFIRKTTPTRIFLPSGADLHSDHKVVYQEVLISIFHATDYIWPELGSPLSKIPDIYEMAVYCNFTETPDIKIIGSNESFEKKLESIKEYKSQEKIIESLVNKLEKSGPIEYFKNTKFNLYSPDNYKNLF